jgi:hypothetical protein
MWMTNKTVKVKVGNQEFTVNHYNVENYTPRPEAYRYDQNVAKDNQSA